MIRKMVLCAFVIAAAQGLLLPANSVAQEKSATEEREVLTLGMNHVGLTVRDLDKSVAFFVETLNWREVGGYADYPSKFVTDGEIFLTLWQATDPDTAIPFDRKNNVGLHHLALTVTSFEALDILYARFLETDGVVIEFSPELNGPGPTKHMMIREPSGNRLEFAYTPPRK
jgi:lactoylglutathione lyase